jgi:hypothetical protein
MPYSLSGFFDYFESTNLAPQGLCLLWRPDLIWLHVVSDGLIALAYFSIPIVLSVFVIKRPDFGFGWVIFAFAIFVTHVEPRMFSGSRPCGFRTMVRRVP